jgi:FAD/FMN-containing dehydrogenase
MYSISDSVDHFLANFDGEVILPEDQRYDSARGIWNGAVEHHPALIVRPRSAEAVSRAVLFANEKNLPLSVLGGGYDWAGRSVRSQALVVDLAELSEVELSVEADVARVGGGARGKELLQQADRAGVAAVAGANGLVGISAFSMSGGYGPLTPGLGLGADNIISAEVVLADGSIQPVSAEHSPDLLWALRGGGGNFGVVTSLNIRTHRLAEVFAGKVLFPWKDRWNILEGFGKHDHAPDGIAATVALVTAPNGLPAVALAPCWQGKPELGEYEVGKLVSLGDPIQAVLKPMKPVDLFSLFEASAVPHRRYAQQTRWLRKLDREVAKVLLNMAEAMPSPFSAIAVQSFHGAPTRVASDETAYALREPHFLVSIVAAWEENTDEADIKNRRWAHDASSALEPFSFPGGYPGLLGPDEKEQLAMAYGANLVKLQEIKRKYDPRQRFTANGPIPL